MTCWCVSENLDSLEVHILSGGSKLQIARSQLLDSGTYTCIASNPEGKAQKTYVLSIQGKKWGRVWGRELVEHWVNMALSVLGTLRSHHHIEKWRIWPVTFVTRGESGWRIQYFWFKICMEKNILKAWLWNLNRVVQVVCVCCWSRPSFSWALELPCLAHTEMDSGAVVLIVPWEELAKTYCQNFLRNTSSTPTSNYKSLFVMELSLALLWITLSLQLLCFPLFLMIHPH